MRRRSDPPPPPATGRLLAALWLAALLALPPRAAAAAAIGGGETLDLPRCIAIALEHHPSLTASRFTLQAGESRVAQARSGYYPQLTGTGGYSRTDPTTGTSKPGDNYNTTLSLSQNLYDFGRTDTQVAIQGFNRDASRADLEEVRSRIVFGVKQAYWGLLQSDRRRAVARETVGQLEQHLARAKGFFEVGLRPKFDVTKAEVDLSNARLSLLTAEQAWRLARVALNTAMGVPEAAPYAVADRLGFEPLTGRFEESLARAYDRRADLQALAVRKQSLTESVELARKGYYPSLTGSASYGWGGDFPLDRGWSVGAQLNVPIFSGFSTKHQVAEAQANLAALAANETLLRQQIHQEVQQAWLNLEQAAERIATAEVSVRQAEENLELARGRYGAGVGNPIEVTDALVALSSARTGHIAALYDYRTAQAALEKATGEP